MGWLGTRSKKAAHEPQTEVQPVPVIEPEPAGPLLLVLVPYVAGVSSYRSHAFHDAPAAADFIQTSVPPELRRGILAFWALHQPPTSSSPDDGGEALVLIASPDGSGQIYVVSFVDLESAQSFARFEVKRGLDLSLLSIYWAQLVSISEGPEGITIAPEEPPVAATAPASTASQRRAAGPPAPAPEPEAGPEPQLVPEAPAQGDAPPAAGPAEEPELDLFAGQEPDAPEPPGELAAAPDSSPAPTPVVQKAAEPVVATPGDEELSVEVLPVPPLEPPPAGEGEGQEPPEAEPSPAIEIAKALRVRRWQKREDPFQGFGSPPGRF